MGGPAVWREITKTPREPFISKFEMEDKSSSAAAEHQHKVTHNRFRTEYDDYWRKDDLHDTGGQVPYFGCRAGRYAGEGPDSGSGELVRQGAEE